MLTEKKQKVVIVMGSQSDYATMKYCKKVLKLLKIDHETKIVSAHRTPDRMYQFAKKAEKNNIAVIIAGAGGSAHLPGMIASLTSIPVGTVAIGKDGAINAALFAASIISLSDEKIKKKLKLWRSKQTRSVKNKPN